MCAVYFSAYHRDIIAIISAMKSYIGDEQFNAFLEKVKHPLILPEIKTIILRYLWSTKHVKMQEFYDEVKTDLVFKDEDELTYFAENVMALWNVLGAHQKEGNYYRFVRFPKLSSEKDLQTRIYVRNLEVQKLIRLLSEDIPPHHNEEFQRVTEPIAPAIGEMKEILSSKQPYKTETLTLWENDLDRIDEKLEEAFNRLGWLLLRIRRGSIPLHNTPKTSPGSTESKTGRNDPCPCGSGRKYKKCCLNNPHIPREQSITFDFGKPVKIDGFRVSKDGNVEMFSEGKQLFPVNAYCEQSHPRKTKKGNKVIDKVPVTDLSKLNANSGYHISNYERVFAVDTNTKVIRGSTISVTCMLQSHSKLIGNETASFIHNKVNAFEFREMKEDPEIYGWYFVIQSILRSPGYSSSKQYALVVDSHLGNIDDYNEKRKVLLYDLYLPDNFTLIYASADKPNDGIFNILIKQCDKHASEILALIKRNTIGDKDLHPASNEPYTSFRHWHAD